MNESPILHSPDILYPPEFSSSILTPENTKGRLPEIINSITEIYQQYALPHGRKLSPYVYDDTINMDTLPMYREYIRTGWLFGTDTPLGIKHQVEQSLKPRSRSKYLVITTENNGQKLLIGYSRIKIFSYEIPEDFVWGNDDLALQAKSAMIKPHIEIDESAISKLYVTKRNSSQRTPSHTLFTGIEQYSRQINIQDIFCYVVTKPLSNPLPELSLRQHGYHPVMTTESYCNHMDSEALGYWKDLTPSS